MGLAHITEKSLQGALPISAVAAGTDTYTASVTPNLTAYATSQRFYITFTNANTGAATINIDSLGAKALTKNGATTLVSGDIVAGQTYAIHYDGTRFQLLGSIGGGGGTDLITWAWTGARTTGSASDRDMESDSEFTSTTPFIIPFACELKRITLGTNGTTTTWNAHVYKNGVTAANLASGASAKAQSGDLSIAFAAGDEVRLRQQNASGSVGSPRITAIFKET